MDSLLFEGLSKDEKENFLNSFAKRKIKKAEVIKKENEVQDKAFFLLEGEVSVIKKSSGEDMQVCNIKGGEDIFFSVTCMIDGGESSTTVIANKASIIMEISQKEFMLFYQANPSIGIKVLENSVKLLTKIIRKNDEKITEMYKTLEEVL